MDHGGLSLERYAAVGAALRYFPRGRKADVLERCGLSSADWDAARLAWSAALEKSSGEGGALLAEWSEAFEAFGQKLREAAPTLDAFAIALLFPPPPPEPEPERQKEIPSYLVTAAAAITARVAASEAEPSATSAPSAEPAKTTAEVRTPTGPGPILPFGGPLTAAPKPPVVAAPPAPAPVGVAVRTGGAMARTADLDTPPKKRPPTMPFKIPEPPAPPPPRDLSKPVAPSGPPPALTFNQYAALKAELAAFPNDADNIWPKYGVHDEADREQIERTWIATLAADPKKQQHWNAVFTQYVSQWAAKKR